MQSSKFIRAITLSGFVILMTGFVAYRSNLFEKYMEADNNRSILKSKLINDPVIDSPVVEKKDPAMMSTSKSMILIDDKIKIKPNQNPPLKHVQKDPEDTSAQLIDAMMYSSKSGVIFPPKTDKASQQKEIDTSPKVFLIEKNIMSSSKSIIITKPWTYTYTPLIFPQKK